MGKALGFAGADTFLLSLYHRIKLKASPFITDKKHPGWEKTCTQV